MLYLPLHRARQRPDHPHVERDDEDGPERVVRDEEEVRDRTQPGKRDADRPGPGPGREKAETREDEDDSEEEVNPAPPGRVAFEEVVRRHDEELVLRDRRDAGYRLEDADQDQDHGGEGVRTDCPPAHGSGARCRSVLGHLSWLLSFGDRVSLSAFPFSFASYRRGRPTHPTGPRPRRPCAAVRSGRSAHR